MFERHRLGGPAGTRLDLAFWHIPHTIQVGWEVDDNVFELVAYVIEEPEADSGRHE